MLSAFFTNSGTNKNKKNGAIITRIKRTILLQFLLMIIIKNKNNIIGMGMGMGMGDGDGVGGGGGVNEVGWPVHIGAPSPPTQWRIAGWAGGSDK